MKNVSWRSGFFIAGLGMLALIVGCHSEPLHPAAAPLPAESVVELPPMQVVEEVRRLVTGAAMNLGVTEEYNGVIVTGYERHPGNWHIGRRWQEQTRYRIAVIPDWREPTTRSRIEVQAQTEQRAAEGQRWDPAPQIHRPERAQAVLNRLVSDIGGGR
jgi:hypothetical protein